MNILAVSDVIHPGYYDHYTPGKLSQFDLILSCGDLSRSYLEFLVTMARCPLVYVRGNHDDALLTAPPEGCICAEDAVINVEGLRILGLGGSMRYRPGENMYTERQMRFRILKLRRQIHRAGGIDILLTHAPARRLGDLETPAHQGFECFHPLLQRYEPAYFIHGHVHRNYGLHVPRLTPYGATTVLNAYDHYVFEWP